MSSHFSSPKSQSVLYLADAPAEGIDTGDREQLQAAPIDQT